MVLQVLKNFAGKTSIHGLGFVVDYRLSVFMRVTWALIFTGAIIWASIQLQFSVTCKLSVKFLRKTLSCKSFLLASIISGLLKTKVFRQSQIVSLFGLWLQPQLSFASTCSTDELIISLIILIELLIFLSLVHRSYKVSHTGSIPE